MLVEPGDRLVLGLFSGLVVDPVVLDALDGHELLDPRGPLEGQDRVVLVVEEFLVLGDDEQLGTVLATADVLDRGV